MIEENHDKLSVLYIGTVFEWALRHFKGDESQFAFVVIFSFFSFFNFVKQTATSDILMNLWKSDDYSAFLFFP